MNDAAEHVSAPRATFCGYCRAPMTAREMQRSGNPDRCPCGRRAITRLPGGVLVHRDGCGGDCDGDCGALLYPPDREEPE